VCSTISSPPFADNLSLVVLKEIIFPEIIDRRVPLGSAVLVVWLLCDDPRNLLDHLLPFPSLVNNKHFEETLSPLLFWNGRRDMRKLWHRTRDSFVYLQRRQSQRQVRSIARLSWLENWILVSKIPNHFFKSIRV
jgi:hypothetical protein